MKKLISIVTPCYNEEENVEEIHKRVKKVFSELKKYRYEHIFIENASTDDTEKILKKIARSDRNVKIIINARNFGWIRSQYYAMLQARGVAVVLLVCDLQDPPEMIKDFIQMWEKGFKIVVGVKTESEESFIMKKIREFYYLLIKKISEVELITNFTGFGLYDQKVMGAIRRIDDPYPYFRGLVPEIGYSIHKIRYKQLLRKKGKSQGDISKLIDIGILGITSYSRLPLRLVTIFGLCFSVFSFLVGFIYFIYKLVFWGFFPAGVAPLVIGLFFFISVQMLFLGIIGEYIGIIHVRMLNRPLVIEKERINF